jgi:hypothetical protein
MSVGGKVLRVRNFPLVYGTAASGGTKVEKGGHAQEVANELNRG